MIPHGTSWGFYTPSGSDWKKQVTRAQHDPQRQTLIEVYSGHGASEEYRAWRSVDIQPDGSVTCPAPSEGYLPRCWQAGELIRERCLAEAGNAYLDADEIIKTLDVSGDLVVSYTEFLVSRHAPSISCSGTTR